MWNNDFIPKRYNLRYMSRQFNEGKVWSTCQPEKHDRIDLKQHNCPWTADRSVGIQCPPHSWVPWYSVTVVQSSGASVYTTRHLHKYAHSASLHPRHRSRASIDTLQLLRWLQRTRRLNYVMSDTGLRCKFSRVRRRRHHHHKIFIARLLEISRENIGES